MPRYFIKKKLFEDGQINGVDMADVQQHTLLDEPTNVYLPPKPAPVTHSAPTHHAAPSHTSTPTVEPTAPPTTETLPIAESDPGTSSLGVWLSAHMNEIAIAGAAVGIIAGIVALVKGMNKSIKVRYNRVVKTLQRAQRDFTLAKDGLNMNKIMPNVGSGIMDWIARVWTANSSTKRTRGNIGIMPFAQQYIDEIAKDFKTAEDAFNKIARVAEELKQGADKEHKDAKGRDSQYERNPLKRHESIDGKTFNSFREAISSQYIVEGMNGGKHINEAAVLAIVSSVIALANICVHSGAFKMFRKDKNGKTVEQTVQVTKESVREICYAIIFNYADKYVNMKQVFNAVGVDTNSLADLNTSSCDKLSEILKKYSKPEPNTYTKQYVRIKKNYDKMLSHYLNIGNGIIANFIKYTEQKAEKRANLIVASKEKLENMWESQHDFYEQAFSHVLVEIIQSASYQNYLNFILEKVMPVFKSGLAGDADYVLDVPPHKGEYYLIRQTQNQPWMEDINGGKNKVDGRAAIAEVVSFDNKAKKIQFTVIGSVEGDYHIEDDGMCRLSNQNSVNFSTYWDDDEKSEKWDFEYSKWISLDPVMLDWEPFIQSGVYERPIYDNNGKQIGTQYLYATGKPKN